MHSEFEREDRRWLPGAHALVSGPVDRRTDYEPCRLHQVAAISAVACYRCGRNSSGEEIGHEPDHEHNTTRAARLPIAANALSQCHLRTPVLAADHRP